MENSDNHRIGSPSFEAMLSAVLRSRTAINVSIQIMDTFVGMRKFIVSNVAGFGRLNKAEKFNVFVAASVKRIQSNILKNCIFAEWCNPLLPKLVSGKIHISKLNILPNEECA